MKQIQVYEGNGWNPEEIDWGAKSKNPVVFHWAAGSVSHEGSRRIGGNYYKKITLRDIDRSTDHSIRQAKMLPFIDRITINGEEHAVCVKIIAYESFQEKLKDGSIVDGMHIDVTWKE